MQRLKNKAFKYKTPVILQGEIAECGLSCLCMVFASYGLRIDLLTLRKKTSTTLNGMTVSDLVNISKQFNFEPKVYRLDLNKLHTLHLPVILHWDLNHFVILNYISKKKAIIHDPAIGKRTITLVELSNYFTGIAVELKPSLEFKETRISEKPSLQKLFKGFTKFKRSILQIFFLALTLQGLIVVSPQYIQRLVDSIRLQSSISYLIYLAILFTALKLIEMGVDTLRSYIIVRLGVKLNKQLGINTFSHLLKLPLSFFEKRHIGDIISRFSAIDKIRNVISQGLVEGLVDGIMSITTLSIILYYNWIMGTVTFMFSALYSCIRFLMLRRNKQANDKMIKLNAAQNTYFIESVRGMQPIKLFGKEDYRHNQWKSRYLNFLESSFDTNHLKSTFTNIKNTLFGLELIIIVLLGGISILTHQLSLGMLYAYIFYRNQFTNSTGSLIDKLLEFKMLSLYVDRLSDIILQEPEASTKTVLHSNPSPTLSTIYDIKVKNLAFSYDKISNPLLENINFNIEKSESVAFIAPSGYGKTTLLKLLMGLLKPTSGKILINDVDLQHIHHSEYRKLIASVMQDDILFSGNLYQNISFFSETIDTHKIIHCAKLASIHDEIISMPMQYHSIVGDMGTTLSGGQKQRVLLARALYAEPKILFLDEATSHLDQTNEYKINQALKELPIIKIIAAHREETIKMADRVIDLNDLSIH